MQEIYIENIGKVISSLKKLELGLKVKIKNKGKKWGNIVKNHRIKSGKIFKNSIEKILKKS